MEKRKPHYPLSKVKTLIRAGKVRMTSSAAIGAARMGFDLDGAIAVVLALAPTDFRKSMTTHADHKIWQDVYAPATAAGDAYLKLTVLDDVLIVSFKGL